MYQLLFMRMHLRIYAYSDTYLLMHLMNITKIESAVQKIAIGKYFTVQYTSSFPFPLSIYFQFINQLLSVHTY